MNYLSAFCFTSLFTLQKYLLVKSKMCSRLNVVCVQVLENPAKPSDPFKLDITFEVFETIKEDVEWELVFVATDGKEEHDQILDSVLIGPIRDGRHKFVFEAPAPDLKNLRPEDFMDVTLLLLKCKYREQLLMKIGWFITHAYTDPELIENPPPQPIIEKLQRTIAIEDVRVTTYPIKYDTDETNVDDVEDMDADIENDADLMNLEAKELKIVRDQQQDSTNVGLENNSFTKKDD